MQHFEIRILGEDGSPFITSTLELYSTHSAIGSAVRIARGRPFEVWCDGRCVYASVSGNRPPPSPYGAAA